MYEEDKDRNWNREPEEERPKKGGILKKAAWITAGALLFGTCLLYTSDAADD